MEVIPQLVIVGCFLLFLVCFHDFIFMAKWSLTSEVDDDVLPWSVARGIGWYVSVGSVVVVVVAGLLSREWR